MTENQTTKYPVYVPEPVIFTENDVTVLLDESSRAMVEETHESYYRDAIELAHDWTHIGDTREHDPFKTQKAMEVLTWAASESKRMLDILLDPNCPQQARDDARQALYLTSVAGITATELHSIGRQLRDDPTMKLLNAIFGED